MQPDRRAAFLAYVEHRHRPAFSFIDSYGLVIGKRIRDSGIAYYKVPPGFGLGRYRYTIVNDQVVLVEPGTHRIVDIFE